MEELFIIYGSEELTKSQINKLKKLGYVLTSTKENLYHPMHWEYIGAGVFDEEGELVDCGDFYVYEDAFKAKTPEAKTWADE